MRRAGSRSSRSSRSPTSGRPGPASATGRSPNHDDGPRRPWRGGGSIPSSPKRAPSLQPHPGPRSARLDSVFGYAPRPYAGAALGLVLLLLRRELALARPAPARSRRCSTRSLRAARRAKLLFHASRPRPRDRGVGPSAAAASTSHRGDQQLGTRRGAPAMPA